MTDTLSHPGGSWRWKTMVIDAIGLVAVIWSIPLAIVLVGAPIALAVAAVRWIFG